MPKRILINREECEVRVAFLEENNRLAELHTERIDEQTIVNNIYRGKVQDVVPGLQAAFIDAGLERNMFLHFMDIRPEALVLGSGDQKATLREAAQTTIPGRIQRPGRRPRQDPRQPQAAAPVKKGQDLIVQVVKDEIGGKAPRVTANLSLAGRYVVMLPFPSQEGGVSRKIAQGEDRHRLKRILSSLKTVDHSFIVRTAGLDQDEDALRRDAQTLEELWDSILGKYKELKGPGLLHNDRSLISRMVRDAFPPDFDEVVCDDPTDAAALRIELADQMPGQEGRVTTYEGPESLFERYGVEKQIEASLAEKIFLKSGGSIVIDENEALTAIDVNTGKFTGRRDQEKTSLQTNLEACEEIARQLRIRDMGGIIVIDFIDMVSRGHQEKLQEEMRKQLAGDRSRTAIGRYSDFGLMLLTRKRQRTSLQKQTYDPCPYCKGSGFVRNSDQLQRRLKYDIRRALAEKPGLRTLVLSAHPSFVEVLNTRFRGYVERLRTDSGLELICRPLAEMHMEDYQLTPISLPESKGLELPAERIPADKTLDLSTAPAPKAPAAEETAEAPAAGAAPEGEAEAGRGRRRRRRRESGPERRRRRERELEEQQAASPAGEGAPGEPVALTNGDPDVEEAARAVEAALSAGGNGTDPEAGTGGKEAAAQGSAASSEAEESPAKRRTRRGTRGGRGRRRRTEEAAEAATEQPKAEPVAEEPKSTPAAPQEPPKPLPPLKVPSLAKKPAGALLSILDDLERAVEGLQGPAPAAAEEQKAAAAAPAQEAKAEAPAEEKKPVRRRTTRRKAASPAKKEEAAKEPAAAESPEPEAKEEKKTTSTRTRKRATTSTGRTRKAAAAEGESSTSKPASATTSRARKTKKTGESASPGTKSSSTSSRKKAEEAAPAGKAPAKPAAKKSTTRKSTASTRRKKSTTTKTGE